MYRLQLRLIASAHYDCVTEPGKCFGQCEADARAAAQRLAAERRGDSGEAHFGNQPLSLPSHRGLPRTSAPSAPAAC